MTLTDAIRSLKKQNKDHLIIARRPWTDSSECVVAAPNERLGVPDEVQQAGLAYFLEVRIALEILEDCTGKVPKLDDKVRLLLYYAEHDAFPQWLNDRCR